MCILEKAREREREIGARKMGREIHMEKEREPVCACARMSVLVCASVSVCVFVYAALISNYRSHTH